MDIPIKILAAIICPNIKSLSVVLAKVKISHDVIEIKFTRYKVRFRPNLSNITLHINPPTGHNNAGIEAEKRIKLFNTLALNF